MLQMLSPCSWTSPAKTFKVSSPVSSLPLTSLPSHHSNHCTGRPIHKLQYVLPLFSDPYDVPRQVSAGGGGRGWHEGAGGGVGDEEGPAEGEGGHVQVPESRQSVLSRFGNCGHQSFLGRETVGRRVTALATSSCLVTDSPARFKAFLVCFSLLHLLVSGL